MTSNRTTISLQRMQVLQKVCAYLLLAAGALIFVLPFGWMVATALKTNAEVFTFPPSFLPEIPQWQNFVRGWTALPFTRFFLNTVLVVSLAVLGNVVSCVLAAYAFARLHSRFRGFFFVLTLGTMMIPLEIVLIPQFILFTQLGLTNTLWPLFLPAWFGYPLFIFLLRQFFKSIPAELHDAARIDGASELRILLFIFIPLAKLGVVLVAVFSFVANWNNLIGPIIYLRSQELYTMAVGLRLFQGQYVTDYNQMMAVSALSILPIVIVFFFAQRAFVQGSILSGLGGR